MYQNKFVVIQNTESISQLRTGNGQPCNSKQSCTYKKLLYKIKKKKNRKEKKNDEAQTKVLRHFRYAHDHISQFATDCVHRWY